MWGVSKNNILFFNFFKKIDIFKKKCNLSNRLKIYFKIIQCNNIN